MQLKFRCKIVRKGSYHFLDVPAFPEIVFRIDSEALNKREIYAVADRTIRHAIQARLNYNDDVPVDNDVASEEGEFIIQMTPLVITKVLLHIECQQRGWTKSELARQLDITPTTAARLLDLFHESRSEVVSYAFFALGKVINSEIDLVQVD